MAGMKSGREQVSRVCGTVVTGDRISGWTSRRRVAAVLRMAYRIVGLGRQRSVGRLCGGASIGTLLAAMGIGVSARPAGAAGHRARLLAATALAGLTGAAGLSLSIEPASAQYFAGGGTATGTGAIAIGGGTPNPAVASGDYSIAMGNSANAQAMGSVAIGYDSNAVGLSSLALGANAFANNVYATALGNGANASGDSAVAIGSNSRGGGALGIHPS